MRTNTIPQIAVIEKENAIDFQKEFNNLMSALAGKNPTFEIDHNKTFCAIITYEETTRQADCAADEFHADGIMFKCRNCPLREMETDGRKKRVKCQYADVGWCHLDREACEVFYRRYMLREIKPIGEPIEIAKKNRRQSNDFEFREIG